MHRTAWLALLLLASCAHGAPDPGIPLARATVAVTDVHVVDVASGEVLPDRTVLIRDDRIIDIVASGAVRFAPEIKVIDGRGGYLIPGLWDMHVHAWDRALMGHLLLANGVTGVREMGSGIGAARIGSRSPWGWREDVRAGAAPGPRMVAAGAILDGGDTTWYRNAPFFKVVRTPMEGRRWVDSLASAGADFVKVYSSLDPIVYSAIVTRARELGLPVDGHVPSRLGARAAAQAGQRAFEHLRDLLVSASHDEEVFRAELASAILVTATQAAVYYREMSLTDQILATYDDAKARELAHLLAERRVWQVPTLVVLHDPRYDDPEARPDSARMLPLPPLLKTLVTQYGPLSAEELSRGRRRFAAEMALVKLLHDAGVPILAGTDLANPWIYAGFSLHDELAMLVRAGLTPLEALRTATVNAAQFLGREDDLGAVAVGKLADLVLLEGNPLEEIANTTRIRAVVMNGTVFDREALDAMLAPFDDEQRAP